MEYRRSTLNYIREYELSHPPAALYGSRGSRHEQAGLPSGDEGACGLHHATATLPAGRTEEPEQPRSRHNMANSGYVALATTEERDLRSCHSHPTQLAIYEGVCFPLLKFTFGTAND